MIKTFDGHRYLMRDQRPKKEILELWEKVKEKYPNTKLTFHRWLVQYGKVYLELKKED